MADEVCREMREGVFKVVYSQNHQMKPVNMPEQNHQTYEMSLREQPLTIYKNQCSNLERW